MTWKSGGEFQDERDALLVERDALLLRLDSVTQGYDHMSAMVWKFLDMSYLDDEPETRRMLDRAHSARY